jgi:hypothetical protein
MDYPVALVQGIYFFVTGIWPILSMRTFLLVTGPKTDLWLVKTVGLVLASIGATLLFAGWTAQVNPPVIFLAISAALSLTIVEIVYVAKHVISPVYLGDTIAEVILIGWWLWSLLSA